MYKQKCEIVWHCTKHPSYGILWGLRSIGRLFYCGWKSASTNVNSVYKSCSSCLFGTAAKPEAGFNGPAALEANFLQEVRRLKAGQAMVRPIAGRLKEERDLSSSEKEKKKRTQLHYFCTAVLGKQHDSKMEHFLYTHPLYCPTRPKTPGSHGGQHIRSSWEEQDHSLLFHLRSCQTPAPPQLPIDPRRFASHTINV